MKMKDKSFSFDLTKNEQMGRHTSKKSTESTTSSEKSFIQDEVV